MRRGKFCPKCGKQTESLYQGLCDDCFVKKIDLPVEIPEKLVLGTCKMCGRTFLGESKFSSQEAAADIFLQKILKNKKVKSATYRISGDHMFLNIFVESEGFMVGMEKKIHLVNKSITCNSCNLQKSSYYNVILQIRVPEKMREKIVEEVAKEIKRLSDGDPHAFISGVVELKEGVDLMIGSKNATRRVVKYLQNKYGVETRISRKLSGLIEGRRSYRDTVLVSLRD